MRVLIVTPYYLPDLGPSAPLFGMLAQDLVRRGHEVAVIATVPHYPSGAVPNWWRRPPVARSREAGVEVTRVWVPSHDRRSLAQRGVAFACYQSLAAAVAAVERFDVALVSNPGIEVLLAFATLASLRRKKCVFSVHDLYPDIGAQLGVFRRTSTVRAVSAMEQYCLTRAARVRVLSPGFGRNLERRGIDAGKIRLIWDWLDTEFIAPLPRHNPLSAELKLDDVFTVMYAGNIGLSQNLETAVAAAALLRDLPTVRFVFVGDGAMRPALQRTVADRRLLNVTFVPFQRRERLPQLLATADVGLVALGSGIGRLSVPSKCFSLLASGRPIIACVERDSDTARVIDRAGAGGCVDPGDPAALADRVRELYHDPARAIAAGESGRAYAVANHSRGVAAAAFDDLLREVADTPAV